MSHKWWHKWGSSPEDEALEQLEELRAQENRILQSNEKYGEGAVELSKDDLKEIQDQIKQIKIDYPDVEAIQSGFAADDTGIFSVPQETDMLEGIKRNLVDVGLEKVGAPDIVDYDAATEVIDTFKEEGAGGAVDKALTLIKNGFIQEGLKVATGAGIPINTIMALANNSITGPYVQPVLTDANNMFSDVTGGYGPKIYNAITSPFNFFGGTSGIFGNRQNIVPVEEPAYHSPQVAGPSEDYGFDDSGGFIGEGWKKGGLASMTRVLRR